MESIHRKTRSRQANTSKTGITGIWISAEVLKMDGLSFHQKAILSLAAEFNVMGTMLNNNAWSGILGISDRHVRRLLADLEKRRLLRKDKGKNGHRLLRITPDIMSTIKPVKADKMSGQTAKNRTKCPEGADLGVHHKQKRNKRTNKDASKINSSFQRFWDSYPRKTNKRGARKVWQKLKPDQGLVDTILAALKRHKMTEQWQKDEGKYIPHPSTWLNGRRWEDEIETPQERVEQQFLAQFPQSDPTEEQVNEAIMEC